MSAAGLGMSITQICLSLSVSHTLRNINDFTIQLGITRRHSYSYYGEMVKVRRAIPHPQYNECVPHDNDIALFQVRIREQQKNRIHAYDLFPN